MTLLQCNVKAAFTTDLSILRIIVAPGVGVARCAARHSVAVLRGKTWRHDMTSMGHRR